MKTISTSSEIQHHIISERKKGKSIGFVPTMGYLHKAHGSLIKASKKDNNITVVSIYVNPTQFGPGEDYESYPRDLDADIDFLKKYEVDYLFAPESSEEIYPNKEKIDLPKLPERFYVFEGERPGDFFRGVAQVCSKLFEIIPAHNTYFGQKDYQQTLLIDWLINTLEIDLHLNVCPTFRESDGLAISSRNAYLTDIQRPYATILNKVLENAQHQVNAGITDTKTLEKNMINLIEQTPHVDRINYLGIRGKNIEKIKQIENEAVAILGIKMGNAKLIDNKILKKM